MKYESIKIIQRYLEAYFRVNKRMHAEIREVLQDDMTMDQFQLIDYITKHGRATSTELSDAFSVGKSSITAIITRLVDKGILERTPDHDDRRVVYLSLTPLGEGNYKKTQVKFMDIISKYMTHFSDEEIEVFLSVLEKLANLLEEGSEED